MVAERAMSAALEADVAAMLAGLQEAVHPAYCPDCRHRQRDHKRIGATCCQEDWCGCQREFHVVSLAAALASSAGAAWLETAREVVEALDEEHIARKAEWNARGGGHDESVCRVCALLAKVKTWAGR